VIFTQTNYTILSSNAAFWNGVKAFHSHLVPLNDNGGTGYYYISPSNPVPGVGEIATFVLYKWFVNQTDPSILGPLYTPLLADLQNATDTLPFFRVIPFPSLSSVCTTIYTGADYDGLLVQLGSRLVSRDFINSPGSPGKVASALSGIKLGPGDYIEGNAVAGGQVSANANIDIALNPAWRKTIVHLLFTR
jgi:hypothetical protein